MNKVNSKLEKIRILHVITSLYSGGGAEKHLFALARSLDHKHFDQAVAYLQPFHDLVEDFQQLEIPTYPLSVRNWFAPGALLRLVSIIRQGGFDIIHSHLYPADVYVGFALRFVGGPRWISSHHNEPPFLKKPLNRSMLQLMFKRQSGVIAISESVKRYLHDQCGLHGEKIRVIHYGLDPEDFRSSLNKFHCAKRNELGLREDDFVVVMIGRLVPQKGHHYTLEAMAQVAKKAPGIKLLIVGEGPLEADLKKEVISLGIESNVFFLGFCSDIARIIERSDVLLLSSLYEGFGLVLLEAMALKKPIIAAAVGPVPEIVVNGETGILVPSADSNSIAQAISKIYADPNLRTWLGTNGYQRLKSCFTRRAMALKTEECYREVLSIEAFHS